MENFRIYDKDGNIDMYEECLYSAETCPTSFDAQIGVGAHTRAKNACANPHVQDRVFRNVVCEVREGYSEEKNNTPSIALGLGTLILLGFIMFRSPNYR